MASPGDVAAICDGYRNSGYRTVRLKLGTSPHHDRDVVAAVRSPVAIQSDRAFGAPHVDDIRTESLAELVEAGEEIEVVASDFGISESDLRAALAYEWQRPLASAA